MADLYHSVNIVIGREDRGKTHLQWRVSGDDIDALIAEFRARFGEPVLEATSDGGLIDEVLRQAHAHGAAVIMERGELAPAGWYWRLHLVLATRAGNAVAEPGYLAVPVRRAVRDVITAGNERRPAMLAGDIAHGRHPTPRTSLVRE
jgi:hypothetical protein